MAIPQPGQVRPWVNTIPMTAPSQAVSQPVASPNYRSDLMTALLANSSRPDYSNVRTPLGGLAEALKEGIQGWQTKKAVQGEEQKRQAKAGMLARALLGEDSPYLQEATEYFSAGLPVEMAQTGKIAERWGTEPDPEWDFKEVNNRLYRTNPSGKAELVDLGDAAGLPADMFSGKSVEAESLNYLVSQGVITPEQAAELGAGKTITNPTTGEIMFMTPSGVFSRPPSDVPDNAEPQTTDNNGMIPLTGGKASDAQRTAAGYADRMTRSDAIITKLESAGTSAYDATAAQVPLVGNYLISEDYQKLEQAERDFVNAILRRESGAVISDEEFDNAKKQYFPQPGDSLATIEQKRGNRQIAIEGLRRAAGPTYEAPASINATSNSGQDIYQMPDGSLIIFDPVVNDWVPYEQ